MESKRLLIDSRHPLSDCADTWYSASGSESSLSTDPQVGRGRFDVCVIGGGISGCSAALHLAENGYSVVLLEAAHIGSGASGRSGGQILPGLGASIASVSKAVGSEAARKIWDLTLEAVDLCSDLVERHRIQCSLQWGCLHAAVKQRQASALQAGAKVLREEFDYPHVQWVEGQSLQRHVVTDLYKGAVYYSSAGHLHPLDYTRGLARAAVSAGVVIHENSPAIQIDQGQPILVRTPSGEIVCDFLVLAANAYQGFVLPRVSSHILSVTNYILATERLSGCDLAQVLPKGDAVFDANHLLDYFKLSSDGRLLFGGGGRHITRNFRLLKDYMQSRVVQLFPALAGVDVEYFWSGKIAITRNRMPDFGKVDENFYYLQGYSGHGMALAGLGGKLVCEAICGKSDRFDLLASIPHSHFPGSRLVRASGLELGRLFYRVCDWF